MKARVRGAREKAQGSLEYLIITACVLAIAAVVVLFLTGAFGRGSVGGSVANCKTAAADCAMKWVTTINPPCPSCDSACMSVVSGKEIYPGAIGDCRAGHPYKIYEGAKIDVLEVYPCAPVLDQVTQKYGQEMFNFESMSIEEFNSGANLYKYDVIAFGFADCFGGKEISPAMVTEVDKLVRDGGAFLITHDTLCYNKSFDGFLPLIGFDCSGKGLGAKGTYTSATRLGEGELTTQPYALPPILPTQLTHNSNQSVTTAVIWYNQSVTHPDTGAYSAIHMTTDTPGKGRVAFIQTGHSAYTCDCQPSAPQSIPDDEQKMIINVLYWLAY